MKKTCLAFLALFVVLACGMTAFVYLAINPLPESERYTGAATERIGGAAIAGVVAGLFLTLAIGAVQGIFLRIKQHRLVAASEAGGQPIDGAKIAAAGVLVADGPTLVAPLSGTPCVTYDYQITYTTGGKSSSTVTSCWGYGLTPCHVETPAAQVRILAYTDFEFAPETLKGPEMLARARAYFAATTFVTIGLGAITSAFRELKAVLADDDGSIKTDFGPPPTDLEDPRYTFQEHAVADREDVCAFGTYSASRGGLIPVSGSADVFPVALRRGSAARVRRKLVLAAFGQFAATLLMIAFAAGAVAIYHVANTP